MKVHNLVNDNIPIDQLGSSATQDGCVDQVCGGRSRHYRVIDQKQFYYN